VRVAVLRRLLVDLPRLVVVTMLLFAPARVLVLVDVPVRMGVAVNRPVGVDVLVAVLVLVLVCVLVCVHRALRGWLQANAGPLRSPPLQAARVGPNGLPHSQPEGVPWNCRVFASGGHQWSRG